MSAENPQNNRTIDHKPHAAFFRQSGWLMLTAVVGGALTYGVHFLNKVIDSAQYDAFGLLLSLVACLPVAPLQMVFTQQTALALNQGRERQLADIMRKGFWGILILSLGVAALVFCFQDRIVSGWRLPGAISLWVTVLLVPLSLWLPLASGVLQGRQDFFWLGWSSILGGGGRLAGAVVLVLAFHLGALGMMLGVLVGALLSVLIAIWRTRDLWMLPVEGFFLGDLFKQSFPLVLGFGASQFLFTSDTMFAKHYFSNEQMKPYIIAGTLARALLWLVMPLAAVMFPKLVQVRSDKAKLFGLVVLGTAILSICGAASMWVLGPYLVRFVANPGDVQATVALIPWYAGAMVPLAMANVLVNDLMARSKFQVVPFMVALAGGYCLVLPAMLSHYPGHIELVLQILGGFNLALLAICALFNRLAA